MRVLVCQTPRLTYVQVIELLQYETINTTVDLALFPEMCIDHPPQLTEQGELTLENIALMMLSKWSKQHRTYIVLGSVEERGPDGKLFDTCVTFDREGQIAMLYRKQSVVGPSKAAGDQPGFFQTEFGPIGVLLGGEAEEEERWQDLLEKRPFMILNPCRVPQSVDVALVRAHPELQVVSWHKSFSKIEHIVEAKMRSYQCSFLRADAPLNEGGAGSSILVESHRSILPPSWNAITFVVEILHPSNLQSRKLPGWRPLAIHELVQAAMADRTLLTHEELQRGPRYHLWSMRPERPLLLRGMHWGQGMRLINQSRKRGKGIFDEIADGNMSAEELLGFGLEQACSVSVTTKDGRLLDVVATTKGTMIIWESKLKTVLTLIGLGGDSYPTAAGPGRQLNQFVLAASTKNGFWLRLFETSEVIMSTSLARERLPWKQWEAREMAVMHSRPNPAGLSVCPEGKINDDAGKSNLSTARLRTYLTPESRRPIIRDVFQINTLNVFAVVEVAYGQAMPHGLLINMETSNIETVNIYGDGPPPPEESDEDADEEDDKATKAASKDPTDQRAVRPAPLPIGLFADRLVHVQVVEQKFRDGDRSITILVCLYTSNRLMHVTLDGFKVKEVTLLEDTANNRQRKDMPLWFSALPNPNSTSYHLVASYTSGAVKWWQVSFDQCRLQAHAALTYKADKLCILDWPATIPSSAPVSAQGSPRTETQQWRKSVSMVPSPPVAQSAARSPNEKRVSHKQQHQAQHHQRSGVEGGSYGGARQSVANVPASLRHRASLSASRAPALPPLTARAPLQNSGDAFPNTSGNRASSARISPVDAGIGDGDQASPEIHRATTAQTSHISSRDGALTHRGTRERTAAQQRQLPTIANSHQTRRSNSSTAPRVGEIAYGGTTASDSCGHGVLVATVDSSGGLMLFLGRGGRLSKVYTCSEHYCDKVVSVASLTCSSRGISVLQNNGELRFLEFKFEDQTISLLEVPLADNAMKHT